jgi:hypothetical protein
VLLDQPHGDKCHAQPGNENEQDGQSGDHHICSTAPRCLHQIFDGEA